ncbi:MAG: hypothetical protein HRT89_21360, partial [Lentisphaeria bacterium]|nr:hypothetical protein [Lentisphaeria bacterium]
KHLDHPFGSVGICLTETLRRIGSKTALEALVEDLSYRRWDPEIHKKREF